MMVFEAGGAWNWVARLGCIILAAVGKMIPKVKKVLMQLNSSVSFMCHNSIPKISLSWVDSMLILIGVCGQV